MGEFRETQSLNLHWFHWLTGMLLIYGKDLHKGYDISLPVFEWKPDTAMMLNLHIPKGIWSEIPQQCLV